MDRPREIEFASPGLIGSLKVWVGLPVIGLVIVLIAVAAFNGLFATGGYSKARFYLEGIMLLGFDLWLATWFVQVVRNRHAFTTRYVLSEFGVVVKPPEIPQRQISWSDFESSVEYRALRYIQLVSAQLDRPVTLMFGSPGSPSVDAFEKFRLARELLSRKLGSRFRRQWW